MDGKTTCNEKLLGFKNWLDGKVLVPKTCLDSNIDWMGKLLILKKCLDSEID